MDIILNGKSSAIPDGYFLTDLIIRNDLNSERIIVQVNDVIIKNKYFNTFLLQEKSTVEILSIVGGG